MKKWMLLMLVVTTIAACNNGNEGSASVPMDSLRIKDSTHLVDSLALADSTNRLIDTTVVK